MSTHRSTLALLFVFGGLAMLTTGCGRNWKAEIDSNTRWYAVYGGVSGSTWVTSEESGTGSRTIDLPDDDRICCSFQQEGSGYLKVEIKDTGGGLFHLMAEDSRKGATNVNGGIINICTEGTVPQRAGAAPLQ